MLYYIVIENSLLSSLGSKKGKWQRDYLPSHSHKKDSGASIWPLSLQSPAGASSAPSYLSSAAIVLQVRDNSTLTGIMSSLWADGPRTILKAEALFIHSFICVPPVSILASSSINDGAAPARHVSKENTRLSSVLENAILFTHSQKSKQNM